MTNVELSALNLSDACEVWQSGRDGGSSPLRAAARILTGVPHYFRAEFIDELDRSVADDEQALFRARTLLTAVSSSLPMTTEQWRSSVGLPGPGFASRGIASKPGADEQIEELVAGPEATVTMPLWGFSLSEDVAVEFGDRFLFRLRGPYHAVAAWLHSGVLDAQQELIGSGIYRVVGSSWRGHTHVVDLEETAVRARRARLTATVHALSRSAPTTSRMILVR